ncbi:MAG: WcaI family glycosyltransferase [Flavobacteriaceae bacterium]|nr:WcaI family glycosyltransferase [Bacteroidia bacterium]NNK87889.1 WcaI family glycosyltransferase [Flavobacteriaceae bacterium]
MKRKITIIGVNYAPEDSAIGLYSTQMAEYLAQKGYDIRVITGFPYYPQWKIHDSYKGKPIFYSEELNGVKIRRFKQYVPQDPSFSKRILHLLSFTAGSLINCIRNRKADIVICIIPFTTSAVLGRFLKFIHGSKIWIHIQDFEFDAAIESGLVKDNKKRIIRFLIRIEKALLKSADRVSTISNGMLNRLEEKTDITGYYFTNWLDLDRFNTGFTSKHAFMKPGKFNVLYSGNIGYKQDWDLFFQFLDRVKDLDQIQVVVVGEGAMQEQVKTRLDAYPFVSHHNLVPFEELPLLLNSADLHILFQKDEVVDTVMPSKILGMMGSGRPSVVTGSPLSEVKTIFERSQGGYYLNADDLDGLIKSVVNIKSDKSRSAEMGEKARDFVLANYSKETVLNNFVQELNEL